MTPWNKPNSIPTSLKNPSRKLSNLEPNKGTSRKKKEDFKVMLRKHSSLFISDYCDITGVNVVEHYINLKPNCRPMAQKLRRLGVMQQEALLTEVKKLLQVGFIYLVEDLEWVSSVVVTPKKNGKWRVCVEQAPKCNNKEGPLSSSIPR